MKKRLRLLDNKDLSLLAVLLAGLVLLAVKLVLCSSQRVFLHPDEAVLDDNVMYDAAVAITDGEWLGAYGPLTLAKSSFFALWLAGLHQLGIPFLLGGQLLAAGAALAAAWALRPALKKRWLGLVLFAVLLFSPATTANPALNPVVPVGYITRVYRDNIFPALCLLCVAGMVGYALRYAGRLRSGIGWLVLAGVALAACWLTREDGWWILPFVLGAAVVTAVFVLRIKRPVAGASTVDAAAVQAEESALAVHTARGKLVRCVALLLPFVLLGAGLLAWCGMNRANYGRFILNDFSSGEFADAYGAMTRIEHEDWQPKVAVPKDVREKLYATVPDFALLEPLLEGESYLTRYAGNVEYSSGAFYWALREAAAELGFYNTAQTAQVYFAGLAEEINRLCDEGVLPAGPKRSSVNPPIRAEYVTPVIQEALYSLWFCAIFRQCEPYALFSPASNDPVFYTETIAPMEAFLHEKALTATLPNTVEPYYDPFQQMCYLVLDAIRFVYALLTPVCLLLACVGLGWQLVRLWRGRARRGKVAGNAATRTEKPGIASERLPAAVALHRERSGALLLCIIQLGLLLCMVLRAFMIAYVTVASFGIGTYVMYLASIHPLLLLFAVIGVMQLAGLLRARRVRGSLKT